MLPGSDEADNYAALYYHQGVQLHFFSTTAETYRAFAEMGAVCTSLFLPCVQAHELRSMQMKLDNIISRFSVFDCRPKDIKSPKDGHRVRKDMALDILTYADACNYP